jgi:hypothetical protein
VAVEAMASILQLVAAVHLRVVTAEAVQQERLLLIRVIQAVQVLLLLHLVLAVAAVLVLLELMELHPPLAQVALALHR